MINTTARVLAWVFLGGLGFYFPAHGQTAPALPQAQFIGLFVANLDSTLRRYEQKMYFKVVQKQSPRPTLKYAMVDWNGFLLEMIQNPKAEGRRQIMALQADPAGSEGFLRLAFTWRSSKPGNRR